MPVKLPQERVKINGALLPAEGSDDLISEFLEAGFTGYLLLRDNGDKGLTLFENGHITAAYHSRGDNIIATAVGALLAFREFEKDVCRAWASEIPSDYLRHVTAVYLGNEIIHPTPSKIMNLRFIYETYNQKIRNGILILHSSQAYGVLSIIDGKWLYVTEKNDFNRVFALDDCLLSLYEISESTAIAGNTQDNTALMAYSTLGKRMKETVIRYLKDYFGSSAAAAIQKVTNEKFNLNNYERILSELADFLKLFVSDQKTKPFIADLNQVLGEMVKETNEE